MDAQKFFEAILAIEGHFKRTYGEGVVESKREEFLKLDIEAMRAAYRRLLQEFHSLPSIEKVLEVVKAEELELNRAKSKKQGEVLEEERRLERDAEAKRRVSSKSSPVARYFLDLLKNFPRGKIRTKAQIEEANAKALELFPELGPELREEEAEKC
jgi:hypothetical protein